MVQFKQNNVQVYLTEQTIFKSLILVIKLVLTCRKSVKNKS